MRKLVILLIVITIGLFSCSNPMSGINSSNENNNVTETSVSEFSNNNSENEVTVSQSKEILSDLKVKFNIDLDKENAEDNISQFYEYPNSFGTISELVQGTSFTLTIVDMYSEGGYQRKSYCLRDGSGYKMWIYDENTTDKKDSIELDVSDLEFFFKNKDAVIIANRLFQENVFNELQVLYESRSTESIELSHIYLDNAIASINYGHDWKSSFIITGEEINTSLLSHEIISNHLDPTLSLQGREISLAKLNDFDYSNDLIPLYDNNLRDLTYQLLVDVDASTSDGRYGIVCFMSTGNYYDEIEGWLNVSLELRHHDTKSTKLSVAITKKDFTSDNLMKPNKYFYVVNNIFESKTEAFNKVVNNTFVGNKFGLLSGFDNIKYDITSHPKEEVYLYFEITF